MYGSVRGMRRQRLTLLDVIASYGQEYFCLLTQVQIHLIGPWHVRQGV